MKAFLLAAGKGSRISKKIPEIPKCMLPVGGKPLVMHAFDLLKANGIDDITLVAGYKHDYIDNLLAGENVRIVYNPFFDITNSIASLWMAREYISADEDILVMNADVFISSEAFNIIKTCTKEVVMLADKTHADDGDYFLNTDLSGRITEYGKNLERSHRTCEYAGVAYICRSFVKKFKERLEELINGQKHSLWWEEVLYSFSCSHEIFAADVNGGFWGEVDFIEDYYRIMDYVKENQEQYNG